MADTITPVQSMQDHGVLPGLYFRMDSARLAEHLKSRSAYHARRAEEKRAEVPRLEKLVKELGESIDAVKGLRGQPQQEVVRASNFAQAKTAGGYRFDGSNEVAALDQQITQLLQDVKDHENRSKMFAVMAESLFETVYMLTWQDLAAIELAR